MGHSATSGLLMYLSAHISSHWKELEQNSTQSYMKLKESFDKMLEERKQMNALQFLLNVSWWWRYNKVNYSTPLSFVLLARVPDN